MGAVCCTSAGLIVDPSYNPNGKDEFVGTVAATVATPPPALVAGLSSSSTHPPPYTRLEEPPSPAISFTDTDSHVEEIKTPQREESPPKKKLTNAEPNYVITDDKSVARLPEHLQKIAKLAMMRGDPAAQYSLALAFDEGDGVEVNTHEAIRFYTLSAQQGHAPAQNNLGSLHATGHNNRIDQDLKLAKRWYKAAADNGNAAGQFNLGLLVLKSNPGQALELFAHSSRQRYPMAQATLGTLCLEGMICRENVEKGIKLLRKAADAGDPVALHNLAVVYKHGTGVSSDMDKSQAFFELAKSAKSCKVFEEFERDSLGDSFIKYG